MRLLAQTIIMRSTCENKVFLLLSVSQSHLALPPISTCTLAHPPVSSAWSVLSSPLGHARAHVAYPSAQPREAPDDSPRAGAFAAPPAERNAPAGAALTRRQSARRCVCRTAGRAQRPCGCSVAHPHLSRHSRRTDKVQESGRGRPPRRVCSRPGSSRVRPPVPARVSTCRT